MLTFILIVLVLSFLFRRGGLTHGLFGGGLFGGFPFFMGGGYRRRPPFHHGPMGGHGFGPGMGGHGPMGGPGMGGMSGHGGPHGRF